MQMILSLERERHDIAPFLLSGREGSEDALMRRMIVLLPKGVGSITFPTSNQLVSSLIVEES